jgi:hypothetical protein
MKGRDMREIPLDKGFVALVDDEDYDRLMKYHWRLAVHNLGHRYAIRTTGHSNETQTDRKMERNIIQVPDDSFPCRLCIDHINGNGLDNRRCNLRVATYAQNIANSPPRKGRKYKGVYFKGKSYYASISFNRIVIRIGKFKTEEEAARAYDLKAKEFYGEFAYLNLPNQ